MLVLDSVTFVRPDRKAVLLDVSAIIPSDRRLVIFSHDQKNRIYLLYLLAGIVFPRQGKVHRLANFSFPIGFHAALEYDLSLRENAIIIAKFYNVHIGELMKFMLGFPIVEREFDVRLERLTPRAKLLAAYLLAYCIPFDCYLMDRAVARGDPEIRAIVTSLFEARSTAAGVILTTANRDAARTSFEIGGILHRGQLKLYDSVEEASAIFSGIPAVADGNDEERLLEL